MKINFKFKIITYWLSKKYCKYLFSELQLQDDQNVLRFFKLYIANIRHSTKNNSKKLNHCGIKNSKHYLSQLIFFLFG